MQNARLDEAQAGIKIVGRNTNNLRYADDTTLMAESEEKPKSLLMKVKKESKKSSCNMGNQSLIPGLERFSEEGNENPLQYSCLANPMDGGAWQATVHGAAKSQT